jgi:hypothetical protein
VALLNFRELFRRGIHLEGIAEHLDLSLEATVLLVVILRRESATGGIHIVVCSSAVSVVVHMLYRGMSTMAALLTKRCSQNRGASICGNSLTVKRNAIE